MAESVLSIVPLRPIGSIGVLREAAGVMVQSVAEADARINIVLNWTEELRQRVPTN